MKKLLAFLAFASAPIFAMKGEKKRLLQKATTLFFENTGTKNVRVSLEKPTQQSGYQSGINYALNDPIIACVDIKPKETKSIVAHLKGSERVCVIQKRKRNELTKILFKHSTAIRNTGEQIRFQVCPDSIKQIES